MRVSINQPHYLGWLGYFDRIARSDLHIVLDHVQFEKGSYTNRVKIWEKSERGWQWLTIPVEKGYPIRETPIASWRWVRRHRLAIEQAYGVKPFWSYHLTFFPILGPILRRTTEGILKELGIKTPILYSSDLKPQQSKSQLVLELCQRVGATSYLSGPNGRRYLDIKEFELSDIEVIYHDFPRETVVLSALDYLYGPWGRNEWPQPHLISAHS